MGAEIIPFDFEEQAVRVVMRNDEPWFVAADVCRVLEHTNATVAISRLEEDERDVIEPMTLNTTEGQSGRGGARALNIISESGLYALVFTSRKPEAKRFRKWITAEVLPAIRRTGRFEMAAPTGSAIADAFTPRDWLAMVREARILGGLTAGRRMWEQSPLPPLVAGSPSRATVDPAEAQAALDHLIDQLGDAIAEARHNRDDSLTDQGLRCRTDGLFVANYALPVFRGTRWDGGAHRSLFKSFPEVFPVPNPLSLDRVATRGLVLPWALFEGEFSND